MISRFELIHGDAIDVLPQLAGVAHMLMTDPPYRLTSGGGGPPKPASEGMTLEHTRMSGKFNPAAYSNDGEFVECDIEWADWLPLAYCALAKDADAYVMANDKHVAAAQDAGVKAGFNFHNLLVWHKDTITPNRWYMKNLEFTLYFWKGKARTIADPSSPQLMRCPTPRSTLHPTEKPVALMRYYIENSTKPGDIVLDPFAGSGATGAAALACGRRFIGIEKDETHYRNALARLENITEDTGLFA